MLVKGLRYQLETDWSGKVKGLSLVFDGNTETDS
jgi:hypothetical protein